MRKLRVVPPKSKPEPRAPFHPEDIERDSGFVITPEELDALLVAEANFDDFYQLLNSLEEKNIRGNVLATIFRGLDREFSQLMETLQDRWHEQHGIDIGAARRPQ